MVHQPSSAPIVSRPKFELRTVAPLHQMILELQHRLTQLAYRRHVRFYIYQVKQHYALVALQGRQT